MSLICFPTACLGLFMSNFMFTNPMSDTLEKNANVRKAIFLMVLTNMPILKLGISHKYKLWKVARPLPRPLSLPTRATQLHHAGVENIVSFIRILISMNIFWTNMPDSENHLEKRL